MSSCLTASGPHVSWSAPPIFRGNPREKPTSIRAFKTMNTPQYGFLMPPNWSAHGAAIDQLINIVHIFMFVLFIGWGLFLIYCLIKYRRREGHKASYESNTSKLPKFAEIAVVLFEIFLLVGLSLPVWSKYKQGFPDPKTALEV